jgi:hypothetical protein
MVLAIFVLSLQSIRWSVNKWHRFANHPALPPPREWFSGVNLALADRTCRPTRVKCAVTARGGVGGWRGKPSGRLSLTQGNVVFWWFLRSYLTSRHSSYWYFLLLEQRIFWYYLSFQVMAILCCVAKNSLRGTMLLNVASLKVLVSKRKSFKT